MAIYDVNGNALSDTALLQSAKRKEIFSTSSSQTQGSCIDDSGNIYTAQYSAGVWVKYNVYSGTSTTYSFTGNAYGHMNDLAYNPNNGYIYCASMNNTGEVYVFDPANMSLVNTVYALDANGNPYGMSNLAFNRSTNQFVSIYSNNQEMYFYNTSFQYVKHIAITNYYSSGTRQGGETDGTYFYHVVSPNSNNSVIVPYTLGGVRATDPIPVYPSSSPEFEAMCFDWINKRYFLQSYANSAMKLWWIGIKEYDGDVFGLLEMSFPS